MRGQLRPELMRPRLRHAAGANVSAERAHHESPGIESVTLDYRRNSARSMER